MPEFLDLDVFKQQGKIDFADDDAEISSYLDAAESYLADPANGILCRPIVETEFTESFSSFRSVNLSYPDLITTSAVTYVDVEGQEQTLATIYAIQDGTLVLNPGETWPRAISVTVTYTAGWPINDVPDAIRQAGYFIARSFYEEGSNINHNRLRSIVAIMVRGFRRQTI